MSSDRQTYRGIALVAVLAILTVLALISVTFVLFTATEADTSKNIVYHNDALILAEAGIEHAKSLLWHDALFEEDKTDSTQDNWNTALNGTSQKKAPEADVDMIPNNGPNNTGADSMWIPVFNDKNILVGRYAVLIEDECSKINLNVASIVSPHAPNEGLSPREILLGDGIKTGLPFSRDVLKRILNVRYGPNNVPGDRTDDNNNNSYYMEDGLDNNANGIIDELDEGVNELDEFVAERPYGDDRSLFTLQDTLSLILPDVPPTRERTALLRKYGTLVSQDSGLRWDAEDKEWVQRQNLNISSARELFQAFKQANERHRFEGNSREMRRFAASIADYRDENNVLSTVSSEYGVESICFNEILANEGSKMRLPYRNQAVYGDDRRVHSLPYYYGSYDYRHATPYQESDVTKREEFDRNAAFPIVRETITKSGNGVRLKLRDFPWSAGGYAGGFTDFKKLLVKRGGFMRGDQVIWPENIWQNGYLCVYSSSSEGKLPEKAFKILRSTRQNEIHLRTGPGKTDVSPQDFTDLTNGTLWIAHIRSWTHEKAYYAEHPQVNLWSVFSGLKPGKYYRTYIQETNLETPTGDTIGGDTYSRVLDVDGNLNRYSEKEIHRLRYPYMDGEAQRADSQGCLDVYLTSAKSCGTRKRNRFNAAYFSRPDVIELLNIGNRPVSLRGWSLVANTGSLAYELGVIKGSTGYSREESGRTVDTNPVIRPNEYFYLCNNEEIFDRDFGTIKNGTWGSGAAEQMPMFEINDDTWGVRFKILNVREARQGAQQHTYVRCENEHWKKDQFIDEVAEFQTDRDDSDILNSPDGVRYLIEGGNTRNTLFFPNLSLSSYSDIQAGDYVMIVGLPRIGGFVSMTLKNEYGQIATRLIEYGNPSEEATKDPDSWLNYSSEKPDPTREYWVQTENPTFGGTIQKARNHVALIKTKNQASIKNGPFGSVGEVERVRRVAVWEKDNGEAKNVTSRNLVRGAADYFSTTGIRLDPEDGGTHVFGWKPAFGTASVASRSSITDRAASWQLNEWTNQSVHILSGKNRGETFVITGNTRDTLMVEGRSIPSRKTFYIAGEDSYGLGPGYSSSMYYTRNDTETGEWEWKNKRIPESSYSLYFSGLNDSILTTEFLEENYNAEIDVLLLNYDTGEFDILSANNQYDKNDLFFAGTVQPQHISKLGNIKIKLVPHNLQGEKTSGFAWFNYAYLTPVPAQGRINVNTASERVLGALNGVDPDLASNIACGIDRSGRTGLKPYKSIGDLLDVKGMSIDTFSLISNMITVRSDQYNVYVLAERIQDVDNNGQFNEGDRITATKRLRVLLDRSGLFGKPGESRGIRVVEKETL